MKYPFGAFRGTGFGGTYVDTSELEGAGLGALVVRVCMVGSSEGDMLGSEGAGSDVSRGLGVGETIVGPSKGSPEGSKVGNGVPEILGAPVVSVMFD